MLAWISAEIQVEKGNKRCYVWNLSQRQIFSFRVNWRFVKLIFHELGFAWRQARFPTLSIWHLQTFGFSFLYLIPALLDTADENSYKLERKWAVQFKKPAISDKNVETPNKFFPFPDLQCWKSVIFSPFLFKKKRRHFPTLIRGQGIRSRSSVPNTFVRYCGYNPARKKH